jgi:hypothetical protein
MPNAHLTTTHAKHRALANSVGPQVVAHKSTGGIVNSFPEPVDPVGNASHRLTNHTVALLSSFEIIWEQVAERSACTLGAGGSRTALPDAPPGARRSGQAGISRSAARLAGTCP